jgi:hypothetical protein
VAHTIGGVNNDRGPTWTAKLVFARARLWLVLFVVAVAVNAASQLINHDHVVIVRELVAPAIFASVWTGLSILQAHYNTGRPR